MSEARLRSTALPYAKVANLAPTDRRWRALRRAALRMYADLVDAVTR